MSRSQELTAIRYFRTVDLDAAFEIYKLSFVDRKRSRVEFKEELLEGSWPEKLAWVLKVGGRPAGCSWAARIPGLDRCYEIQGCIHPNVRQKGFGSELLEAVLKDLRSRGAKRAVWMTGSEADLGTDFLLKRGFSLEHREWIMELLDDGSNTDNGYLPAGFFISNFSRSEAISAFRTLYDSIFGKLPWYQPYESDVEVSRDLINPDHLLFLIDQAEPVGFCWQRQGNIGSSEIEPIGLLPAYRGRGMGRWLLLEAVRRMQEDGIHQVRLGVWEENEAAIRLYRRIGFQRVKTVSYYEIDLHSNLEMS